MAPAGETNAVIREEDGSLEGDRSTRKVLRLDARSLTMEGERKRSATIWIGSRLDKTAQRTRPVLRS